MFYSIDRLIKEQIDVYMAPFEFVHLDFYDSYKNAEIIVDYRGGHVGAGDNETEASA